MERLFGHLCIWMLAGPIGQGGNTGREQDWRLLWTLTGELNKVAHSGYMRFERLQT